MIRYWRWGVIVACAAALVALPSAAHLLPVSDSSISAQTLLARINASSTVGYSGYAQSSGGLDLPVSTGSVSAVSDLLGGTNQLRVWWRGAQDWRVDSLSLTGETDLHADASGTWSWDYESDTARRAAAQTVNVPTLLCVFSPVSLPAGSSVRVPTAPRCPSQQPSTTAFATPVRVPRDDDLLPGNLARRLLSEVDGASATRIGSARVAGRSAAGLRITITDARSTIRHIDVWALPSNGLPLRVEVFGSGSQPVVTTSLLDFSLGAPAPSITAFRPPVGAKVRYGDAGDLAPALDNFRGQRAPDRLDGLTRRSGLDLGAGGVYGRGVMELSVLPVTSGLAHQIVPSLRQSTGAAADAPVAVGAGAVNLLLSAPSPRGNRWLLVGTVTPAALRSALAALPPPRGFGRPR